MEEQIVRLQEIVDGFLTNHATDIKVLDAGCGSRMNLHFGDRAHISGIDISATQLLRNPDLEEKIVGDIQSYDFEPSSFDMVICWDVLEHLPNPQAALSRFAEAIKHDGIIILGLPNVLSIKGLLTKYTPHIFHVWAYRYILGVVDAGKDDRAPFKTVLSYTITPAAIKRFALLHRLRIMYFATYDREYYTEKLGIFFVLKRLIKKLSLGVLGDTDLVVALQKP